MIPTISDEENELSIAALEKEPALTADAPPVTVMALARWITVCIYNFPLNRA